MRRTSSPPAARRRAGASLTLADFLPYRLSVAANKSSRIISEVYERRFGITIPEWRVLATLAEAPHLSGRIVAQRTAMDKVQVSRAVASLVKRKFIAQETDGGDRRRDVLRLTPLGRKVYGDIVPEALKREAVITSCLTESEHKSLMRIIAKIIDHLGREET